MLRDEITCNISETGQDRSIVTFDCLYKVIYKVSIAAKCVTLNDLIYERLKVSLPFVSLLTRPINLFPHCVVFPTIGYIARLSSLFIDYIFHFISFRPIFNITQLDAVSHRRRQLTTVFCAAIRSPDPRCVDNIHLFAQSAAEVRSGVRRIIL